MVSHRRRQTFTGVCSFSALLAAHTPRPRLRAQLTEPRRRLVTDAHVVANLVDVQSLGVHDLEHAVGFHGRFDSVRVVIGVQRVDGSVDGSVNGNYVGVRAQVAVVARRFKTRPVRGQHRAAAFVTPSERVRAKHGGPRVPTLRQHEPPASLPPGDVSAIVVVYVADHLANQNASAGSVNDRVDHRDRHARGVHLDVLDTELGDAADRVLARGAFENGRKVVGFNLRSMPSRRDPGAEPVALARQHRPHHVVRGSHRGVTTAGVRSTRRVG